MNPQKLELKQLAPYLPYGLKCQTTDKGKVVVSELNAAYSDNSYSFMNIVESEKGFEDIKPLLRPLSQLIETIEHEGKEFVPIAELMFFHEDSRLGIEVVETRQKDGVYGVKYIDETGVECSFAYHENLSMFGMMTLSDKKQWFTYHQYDLFQKLFEWHFDVFGLIESGLALPIPSIKETVKG